MEYRVQISVTVYNDKYDNLSNRNVEVPVGQALSGILSFKTAVREIAQELVGVAYRDSIAADKVLNEKYKKEKVAEAA